MMNEHSHLPTQTLPMTSRLHVKFFLFDWATRERRGLGSKVKRIPFASGWLHSDAVSLGTSEPWANSVRGKISALGKQAMEIRGESQVLMDKVKMNLKHMDYML